MADDMTVCQTQDVNLREWQEIVLDIFKHIDQIASAHHLHYYMSAGSFLGAVRHKGFIPWDDDIDLLLPREDYECLLRVLPHELPGYLMLKDGMQDFTLAYRFAKVCNIHTGTVTPALRAPYCYGAAAVDLFPMDGYPQKNSGRRYLSFRHYFYSKLNNLYSLDGHACSAAKRLPIWLVQHIVSLPVLGKKLEQLHEAYPYDLTQEKVCIGVYTWENLWLHTAAYFKQTARYAFEDMQVSAVQEADGFLSETFGDYMIPPSEDERKGTHGMHTFYQPGFCMENACRETAEEQKVQH